MTTPLGPAGRIAAFVHFKLTPLVILASLAMGVFSVLMLPREEEPQIQVPMVDVMVGMPGLSPVEIEQRLIKPLEKLLWEIPGVEYLYSTSMPGQVLVIVRFKVGEDEGASIVKLNQKIAGNLDRMPPGAMQPLVKLRSIDDVPILALTLHSKRYGPFELHRIASQLEDQIKEATDVSSVAVISGHRREMRVTLDLERMEARRIPPDAIWKAIAGNNQRYAAGRISKDNAERIVEAGELLRNAEDLHAIVVGAAAGKPVFLRDVARVEDTGAEPSEYVFHVERGPRLRLRLQWPSARERMRLPLLMAYCARWNWPRGM